MNVLQTLGRKVGMTGAALLIAFACLLVILIFILDNARTVQQIIDQRTESRIVACQKDKKFADAHNKLVIALATGGGTREITPEIQPKVDEQLVAVPDCSPAGIKAFYEGQKQRGVR